jgi:hypothetical protein
MHCTLLENKIDVNLDLRGKISSNIEEQTKAIKQIHYQPRSISYREGSIFIVVQENIFQGIFQIYKRNYRHISTNLLLTLNP